MRLISVRGRRNIQTLVDIAGLSSRFTQNDSGVDDIVQVYTLVQLWWLVNRAQTMDVPTGTLMIFRPYTAVLAIATMSSWALNITQAFDLATTRQLLVKAWTAISTGLMDAMDQDNQSVIRRSASDFDRTKRSDWRVRAIQRLCLLEGQISGKYVIA